MLMKDVSITFQTILRPYIFEDINARANLAFSWLYEEYCLYQGFNKASSMYNRRTDESEYNKIFSNLIRGVIDRCSGSDRETLRTYLEKLPVAIRKDILRDRRGYADGRGGYVFSGGQSREAAHVLCRELEAANQPCRGIGRTQTSTEGRTGGQGGQSQWGVLWLAEQGPVLES